MPQGAVRHCVSDWDVFLPAFVEPLWTPTCLCALSEKLAAELGNRREALPNLNVITALFSSLQYPPGYLECPPFSKQT